MASSCRRSLRATKDAHGRSVEVIEVLAPTLLEHDGQPVGYSYIHRYFANGLTWLCSFDDPSDQDAADLFCKVFPDPAVELVEAPPIFGYRGGIHRITRQQPQHSSTATPAPTATTPSPTPRGRHGDDRGLRVSNGGAWMHDLGLVAAEAYRLYSLYRGGVVTVTHFATLTEGRAHFSDLFDAAESGRPASVRRDSSRAAVVDAERLRHSLAALRPSGAELVAEAGGWSMFIPGLPVAADAATVEEVLDEMVEALRDYAEDWTDRLLHTPNHAQNWGLVQLIALSDDQQLRDWLVGE